MTGVKIVVLKYWRRARRLLQRGPRVVTLSFLDPETMEWSTVKCHVRDSVVVSFGCRYDGPHADVRVRLKTSVMVEGIS